MGTRGLMGFRSNKKDHLTYNHFDSYPSHLGVEMAKFIQKVNQSADTLGAAKAKVDALAVVDEEKKPTKAQVEALKKFADTDVSTGKLDEWYVLLRQCQGNPGATLESGFLADNHEFVNDSLFCEWAYVANFDTKILEVYKGFQTEPHTKGRYAKAKGKKPYKGSENEYYPIALVAEIPFNHVTVEKMEGLEKEVGGEEEE